MTTATAPATAAPHRGAVERNVRYFWHSLGQTMSNWAFLVFIIALPTTMYIFFSAIFASDADNPNLVAAIMMVSMAAYGGLGAAMTAGSSLQIERSTGWFRQLMLTPLTPAGFLGAKTAVGIVVIMPALGAVFLAGALRGVRLSPQTWLAVFVILLISLTPMILLGLALGLFINAQAAQAANTIVLLILAMMGGLLVPMQYLPDIVQAVGKFLPSYWIGQLGLWPVVGGDFPIIGVWALLGWTVALAVVCGIGYRRATRSAPR